MSSSTTFIHCNPASRTAKTPTTTRSCWRTSIGFLIKLAFHPYMDRRKWSLDASWVTSLRQIGPRGRDRLELELLWTSTSGTRTKLASDLLLDLDTLSGLLSLHIMRQTWSYSWVSCPHHPISSRNLTSVRSALTRHFRSGFSLSRTLLELTGL